ncbi:hypothetical protein GUJ93_ZPchr0007g3306 [Zizania palustris]|uniref:Uncharacterized protein n=1 Tax=Zizania palustris TaxID=103762 RepID=A0A8J5VYF5_ZIZPA|nr:hypothetical protein GUJ93_ZPchr0007g4676 [Zizania palustris]KAG8078766.1 hypothetical protein GUJ93_ZPchr0007g3306 [Zizania palustris]
MCCLVAVLDCPSEIQARCHSFWWIHTALHFAGASCFLLVMMTDKGKKTETKRAIKCGFRLRLRLRLPRRRGEASAASSSSSAADPSETPGGAD